MVKTNINKGVKGYTLSSSKKKSDNEYKKRWRWGLAVIMIKMMTVVMIW